MPSMPSRRVGTSTLQVSSLGLGCMGLSEFYGPAADDAAAIAAIHEAHPEAVGVILASHGLFAWGKTQRACYENTISIINRAAAWLATSARSAPFGAGAD